jgi:predicted transcriptional regulator
MARRTIDPKIRAEAIARKRAGESTGIIAEDLGVDPTTIRQWCRSEGDDARPDRAARPTGHSADSPADSPSGSGGSWVIGGALLVGTILAFVMAAKAYSPTYNGLNLGDDRPYAPT